ncbi:MAG: T9SS type A sorting domain-containing protein [Bacteroidetes bacterium]|nr:T9SS type A sorting domain-containing protein [Bacteroidota bacterium]
MKKLFYVLFYSMLISVSIFEKSFGQCDPPISSFYLSNSQYGQPMTEFCLGEDIYLIGGGSQFETSFQIAIQEREDADGPFAPFVWGTINGYNMNSIAWNNGQVFSINLSQFLLATQPNYKLSHSRNYKVRLAVSNACDPYEESFQAFDLVCIKNSTPCNSLNGAFALFIVGNGFVNNLFPSGHNKYGNLEIHQTWIIYEYNQINNYYTFLDSSNHADDFLFPVQVGKCYLVIRVLESACGKVCYGQQECFQNPGGGAAAPCSFCGPLPNCVLPTCAPPTFLTCGLNQGGNKILTWNAMQGATSYQIQIRTNDGDCCPTLTNANTYTINVSTNNWTITNFFLNKCFSWKVRAIYPTCTSSFSTKACYNSFTTCNPRLGSIDESTSGILSIYPNPVSENFLNIAVLSGDENAKNEVQITSIDGRLLQSLTVAGNTEEKIDVSSFAKGIYLIQVLENNIVIETSKFIRN